MMKIISIVLQALFVAGGVAAGFWLKSMPAKTGAAAVEAAEVAHAAPAKKAEIKDKPSKAKHDKGHGDAEDSNSGYMKFSRQFIVPVMDDRAEVGSLVIMELNIETPIAIAESLYVQEPKLRDALLGRLLQLSTRGVFDSQLIEKKNLDVIRTELLEAARQVIGDDAKNVLILNIARQNV